MPPGALHLLQAVRTPLWLGVAFAAWVAGVFLWMIHERRSPAATLAWILALALLPVVGIPVYLLVGPRRLARKKLRMALLRRAFAAELAALEGRAAAELSPAGQLQRMGARLDAALPRTARSLRLLSDGDDCYDAQVEAIAGARHHVNAEYYIFGADRAGARIRDALAAAAARGVEVRLLVDAAGSAWLSDRFLAPLVRAGGKVARFNRVLHQRLRQWVGNFRTHRKILVVDGIVGFTGGMNVSDDHSRAARGDACWRDTHLRIDGPAVRGLQASFLEDWLFATGEATLQGEASLRRWFPDCAPGSHTVQIVDSGPDQQPPAIEALYFAAITGAQERIWITTPYFVPGEALQAALLSAALRGVEVLLLVPAATDSRFVDAAGRTYHDALARAGVRIFLYGPAMLHAKTCVVDRDLAIVGSANLDARSLQLNFEVAALVYGGPVVAELAELFGRDLAHAREKRGWERDEPWPRRLFASAARLLSSQL